MIDMTSWKTSVVDVVDGVLLDPRNVRLDIETDDVPQADIIHDLFRNESALGLVDGIAKIGYLTHEVPIVLRRKRKLYVVEGNRRLAALKAIQNPHLAGEYQGRVAALAERIADRDSLRRIEVKIAPTEDDALQLIAALHTGNPRRPWKPERQARFFQAQLDAGLSIGELRSRYPTVELTKFILRSRIVDFFRAARYEDEEVARYVNSKKFSASTLARIYESKQFQDLTGIGLTDDEDARLKLSIANECFLRMAQHIASGMADDRINTRSVGTVKSTTFQELMAELQAIKMSDESSRPAPHGMADGGAGTSESPPGGGVDGSAPVPAAGMEPPTSSKPGRRPRPSSFLTMSRITVPDPFPDSVRDVASELSRLDIDQFPNAASDLMRTFLEKAIKSFAESIGADIRSSSANRSSFVQLHHCLVWLDEYMTSNGKRAIAQAVKRVQSREASHFIGSKDHLDAVNHNHQISATPEDVRNGWTAIHPLLAAMMPT